MKPDIRQIVFFGFIVTLVLLQAGCRSSRRGEPVAGPMRISDTAVANGEKLFMQHCYACHPNGEGGLGPPLNNKPAPRFLIRTQVRAGLGTMPSFDKEEISDEELNDLADYVVALRRHKSDPRN